MRPPSSLELSRRTPIPGSDQDWRNNSVRRSDDKSPGPDPSGRLWYPYPDWTFGSEISHHPICGGFPRALPYAPYSLRSWGRTPLQHFAARRKQRSALPSPPLRCRLRTPPRRGCPNQRHRHLVFRRYPSETGQGSESPDNLPLPRVAEGEEERYGRQDDGRWFLIGEGLDSLHF